MDCQVSNQVHSSAVQHSGKRPPPPPCNAAWRCRGRYWATHTRSTLRTAHTYRQHSHLYLHSARCTCSTLMYFKQTHSQIHQYMTEKQTHETEKLSEIHIKMPQWYPLNQKNNMPNQLNANVYSMQVLSNFNQVWSPFFLFEFEYKTGVAESN